MSGPETNLATVGWLEIQPKTRLSNLRLGGCQKPIGRRAASRGHDPQASQIRGARQSVEHNGNVIAARARADVGRLRTPPAPTGPAGRRRVSKVSIERQTHQT